MVNETTQQERFKYMREELINLSQAQLAKRLGLNNQQRIADIETGRKQKIDSDILQKLNSEYLINLEWLLFGQGAPTKVETKEQYEHQYYNEHITPVKFFKDAKAAAGTGETLFDAPEKDVIYFDKRWLQAVIGRKLEHLSLIRAKGDSMLPDIQDGDLLMVDDSIKEVIPNKIFVIQQDDQLRVKKLKTEFNGDILIISNNPNYPVEVMDKETSIIGQVVWNGSKENV